MSVKKHEWRKAEKEIYIPKTNPAIIDIPEFKYFSVDGRGNPNSEEFQEYVGALYLLSYGVRMSYKKGIEPEGFYQYSVYPLEGVWDLSEDAKKVFDEGWKKEDLVFTIMIRQPDFVDEEFFSIIKEQAKSKKANEKLDEVKLVKLADGQCCQMMHIGSYDDESGSFARMEKFCSENGYRRAEKTHKEIYLSDPRKTESINLKTVLRVKVIKE